MQSTTLLLLAVEGSLPKPDAAIFADTGWEPRAVYDHLDRLEAVAKDAGIPVYRVGRGRLPDDVLDPHRHATIPAYTINPDGSRGMIGRRCTGRYKVEPIERQVRLLLGAVARTRDCRYCDATGIRIAPWNAKGDEPAELAGPCSVCRGTGRRAIVGPVPKGAHAEQWIGFSTDETQRVTTNGFPKYVTPTFPLLDPLRYSRGDCKRWLISRGWFEVPKSACVGCPLHGNAMWRRMRTYDPESWRQAIAFDRAFRSGDGLRAMRFLHSSRLPLDEAPISRVSNREWDASQSDIYDALTEDGDPDGCSPYGCRSGRPTPEEEPA